MDKIKIKPLKERKKNMKKHKKLLTILTAAAAVMALSTAAYAEGRTVGLQIDNPEMTINGEASQLDAPPVIIDSRTFVPVRAIVEALDGNADWDADTKTATLTDGKGGEVKLTVNSLTASYNGEETQLDTAPVIINERTMLPIRFVAESFGYTTDWDADTKSISVYGGEDSGEDIEDIEVNLPDGEVYTDINGGSYTVSYSQDAEGNEVAALTVKDKDGKVSAAYTSSGASEEVYLDKNGNRLIYGYVDMDTVYVIKDGKKTEMTFSDSYELKDRDGNVYGFTDMNVLTVTDKNGKKIAEYTSTNEYHYVYADDKGGTVCIVQAYEDGYTDGFIGTDGKFVPFKEKFDFAQMGSDNKIYTTKYDYLIVSDENYNVIESAKSVPDSVKMIYAGNDKKEYVVDGDFAEKYTLKSDSGTITLTCDPEEEHNKVLFKSDSYGTDDDVYYAGDDGRTYVGKDNIFTVYGKDGKEVDKIGLTRQEETYKTKDGKEYIYVYHFTDDTTTVKYGTEEVELGLIMG